MLPVEKSTEDVGTSKSLRKRRFWCAYFYHRRRRNSKVTRCGRSVQVLDCCSSNLEKGCLVNGLSSKITKENNFNAFRRLNSKKVFDDIYVPVWLQIPKTNNLSIPVIHSTIQQHKSTTFATIQQQQDEIYIKRLQKTTLKKINSKSLRSLNGKRVNEVYIPNWYWSESKQDRNTFKQQKSVYRHLLTYIGHHQRNIKFNSSMCIKK